MVRLADQHVVPIHTATFRGSVGSMKGASSCVESVFSGVKRLLGDVAATMSPELLELYVFIHYNWQYEWMRPSVEEIVAAYKVAYGSEAKEEDLASDSDSDGGDEEEEEEEEDEEDA